MVECVSPKPWWFGSGEQPETSSSPALGASQFDAVLPAATQTCHSAFSLVGSPLGSPNSRAISTLRSGIPERALGSSSMKTTPDSGTSA